MVLCNWFVPLRHNGWATLGKLITEKPVDFVGFDNVVEFNKNRQNDDNVVKAYKDLFSWNSLKKKPVKWLKVECLYYVL